MHHLDVSLVRHSHVLCVWIEKRTALLVTVEQSNNLRKGKLTRLTYFFVFS